MARVDTQLDSLAEADANRTAERNRTAALKLAAFALEQDRPEEWLAETLAILGLDNVPLTPPGVCKAPGCGKAISITTASGAKVGRGYCSNTCLRADRPEEATS